MAQIAQQDNLLIVSKTKASTLEADIKKKLLECAKNGTIFDVVLQTEEINNQTFLFKVVTLVKDTTNEGDIKYKAVVTGSGELAVIELN